MYQWASRWFPRSYQAKVLAVAFCCTTLPLIAVALWLLAGERTSPRELVDAAMLAVAAALGGGLLSLVLLRHLLAPLRLAADALDDYYLEQKLPWLPAVGDDDMARLLRGINRCLRGVDAGRRQLERHAREDPLTHALNRRGCEQALADSITLARNGRTHFVLVVVDMDNLKTINDEHGHVAGDRALVSLVDHARRECLGADDWIGRWGGDEFLLGLHGAADTVVARVHRWLDELAHPAGLGPSLRASAGCAHFRAGMDSASLYREADAAMYEAKFSGGGHLVCRPGPARAGTRAPGQRRAAPPDASSPAWRPGEAAAAAHR